MQVRRQRIPIQGATNFNKTESSFRELKNTDLFSSSTGFYRRRTCIPQQNLSEDSHVDNKKKTRQTKGTLSIVKDEFFQPVSEIRKTFKRKPNIWRIAKSWKFAKCGYVTAADFKINIQKLIGRKVQDDQVKKITDKYANKDGKIDIQNFLKIAYGQIEYSSYKPSLWNINDQNRKRQQKIDNLIDKLQNYTVKQSQNFPFEKQNNHNLRKQSKNNTIQFQKDNDLYETTGNLTMKNDQKDNTYFSKQNFFQLTKNSFNKWKNQQKSLDLDPKSFLNVNQSKTRLGATQFLQNSNYNSILSQPFGYGNTQSVDEKLQKAIKFQKKRQRLQKIQKEQKQNIEQIHIKKQQRQYGTLLRKRLDRQAYEYSNFIKNSWL